DDIELECGRVFGHLGQRGPEQRSLAPPHEWAIEQGQSVIDPLIPHCRQHLAGEAVHPEADRIDLASIGRRRNLLPPLVLELLPQLLVVGVQIEDNKGLPGYILPSVWCNAS